jgi:streptogramin lyase
VSQLKRRVITGTGLTLAILLAIGGIFSITWTVAHPEAYAQQPPITHKQVAHTLHPVAEGAETDHGAQSAQPHQAATTRNPWGITIDAAHGFVWVAEPGCDMSPACPVATQGIIAKYSLADGSLINDYVEPPGYSDPMFVATDADGNVWFTQPNSDAIGKLNPTTGLWSQFKFDRGSMPYDLVFDRNGNLWFTEFKKNAIGFINMQTHQLTQNLTPLGNSNPYGITMDAKGNIWFAENAPNAQQIATFTPTTGGPITVTEHSVTNANVNKFQLTNVRPHLIVADPKTGHIWYSLGFTGVIGEYNPATNTSTNHVLPVSCANSANASGCTHISGLAIDPNGNVWYTDSLGDTVGYIVPKTGKIITKKLAAKVRPHDGLAIDNYGTIWFTQQNGLTLSMWPKGKMPA